MEHISAAELWATVLGVASALLLLANVGEKVVKVYKAAKAPNIQQNTQQNDRLAALEEWKKEVDRKLSTDHAHLSTIDVDNRVTQRALLALLDHGIDGNNIKQMQHAKEELQEHLINRT